MIIHVGPTKDARCDVSFGTLNKNYDIDDLIAIVILEIVSCDVRVCVVRTRDPEVLKDLTMVIGGGKYDNHMKGFNRRRPTGEKYVSAGQVWKDYGVAAIKKVMEKEKLFQIQISQEMLEDIAEEIDREYILPIDLEDNGDERPHAFSFVTGFLPVWFKKNPDYDKAFWEAEKVAYAVLYHIIQDKLVRKVTTFDLYNRIVHEFTLNQDLLVNYGILEIPSQLMPWEEAVWMFNEKYGNIVKVVIFEHPDGGWAAKCVSPSKKDKYGQIQPFPESWAGGNEKTLPAITGIEDAILCHNGRDFIRARSKESIIKMCVMAE